MQDDSSKKIDIDDAENVEMEDAEAETAATATDVAGTEKGEAEDGGNGESGRLTLISYSFLHARINDLL